MTFTNEIKTVEQKNKNLPEKNIFNGGMLR